MMVIKKAIETCWLLTISDETCYILSLFTNLSESSLCSKNNNNLSKVGRTYRKRNCVF